MAARPIAGTKRRLSTPEVSTRECPADPYSTDGLCTRCLELPLEKGLDLPLDRFEIKIADVGTYYRQPAVPGCDLCRLLCDSRMPADHLRPDPEMVLDCDELRAFDVARHNLWVNQEGKSKDRERLLEGYDYRYLAIVPQEAKFSSWNNKYYMGRRGEREGFLTFRRRGSPQPEVFVPQIVEPKFDVSLGKTWLQYCENYHKKLCSGAKRTTKGLRLIDCHSYVVRRAPSHEKYVALSYLWGPPSAGNSAPETASPKRTGDTPLPSDLPAVISDAMKVTIGMGFNYLWVDKFCIDQKDEAEKHGQISQMDSIYHNAELTIIAAAGSDPTYGLPGISSRLRQPYPAVSVRDINIISTLKHPRLSIPSSTWSTRGWTLQESVLSRRRLVFTDDQVYFECTAMNCHESLSSSLHRLHVRGGTKLKSIMMGGVLGRRASGSFDNTTTAPTLNFNEFSSLTQDYTKRSLTYDSDTLRALYGIFREFEASKSHVVQICGIPFLSSVPDQAMKSFLTALSWHHAWSPSTAPRPRRRQNFPSWSWAGWTNFVVTEHMGPGRKQPYKRFEVSSVSIDIGSETISDLSKYNQGVRVEDACQSKPPYLQFRAPLFPSALFSYDDSSVPPCLKVGQLDTQLLLTAGPFDVHGFKRSLEERDRQCIYWGQRYSNDMIMVLQSEGNDTWSRVGLIMIYNDVYRHSVEKLWSGIRRRGPEFDQWLAERPTGYFRVG